MKKFMKSILFMIVVSFLSLSHDTCHGQMLNLQKNINQARESFEDVYYELLKSNYFDEYYNNNLIINTELNSDFYQNGIILFKLIEWLQQNDNRDSRFLLKRMNKLFYLELYRFICKMDPEKTRDGRLFDVFSKIYHYKVPSVHVGVSPVPPFQTTLTKAIVLIFTLNSGNMFYEAKKESLVFALDYVRQEMLDINTGLGDQKIDEQEIRTFFSLLQAYATQEPLVKPGSIRKFVIGAVIITACIGFIYLALKHITVENDDAGKIVINETTGKKDTEPDRINLGEHINRKIAKKWNSTMEWTSKQLGRLGENVGEKLAIGAGKAMTEIDEDGKTVGVKPVIKDFTGDLGRDLVRGIATKGKKQVAIAPEDKNPDLKILGGTVLDGAKESIEPLVSIGKEYLTLGKEYVKEVKPVVKQVKKLIKGGKQPLIDGVIADIEDGIARKHPGKARLFGLKKKPAVPDSKEPEKDDSDDEDNAEDDETGDTEGEE